MKHLRYAWYIARHKWFVFLACCTEHIYWRGIVHDWHKMLPSEWFPYVETFYGNAPKRGELPGDWKMTYTGRTAEDWKILFDRAWLGHQKRGLHHWQYWILVNDSEGERCLRMPRAYWTEMLCDWYGAGWAITGKHGWGEVQAWYEKNKDNIRLHADTRADVESFLSIRTAL